MTDNKMYFALWAEDINRYLHTGYNTNSITEVKEAVVDYISVDNDNPKNMNKTNLNSLLIMTGLSLDISDNEFIYLDKSEDETFRMRVGVKVHSCYLL